MPDVAGAETDSRESNQFGSRWSRWWTGFLYLFIRPPSWRYVMAARQFQHRSCCHAGRAQSPWPRPQPRQNSITTTSQQDASSLADQALYATPRPIICPWLVRDAMRRPYSHGSLQSGPTRQRWSGNASNSGMHHCLFLRLNPDRHPSLIGFFFQFAYIPQKKKKNSEITVPPFP